ncbi:uncharacterized protein LAESUDRAFT_243953 [Laetiporus sulphureus 93-53]|uniref:Uncharacterized protein n=1 Tax=Laetiporus sulphureus 93-53 TaxID=1314785 RepID=A0A165DLR6_9APHY|nr:uncharacterized protein LAESUDRAFT_243953 [Laetiporus sulphureus 93-53]KZT05160.1 hypothetical protein LAESUDRAFT_243953 [Laetiporus sulphureus 93-53]
MRDSIRDKHHGWRSVLRCNDMHGRKHVDARPRCDGRQTFSVCCPAAVPISSYRKQTSLTWPPLMVRVSTAGCTLSVVVSAVCELATISATVRTRYKAYGQQLGRHRNA